MQCNDDPAIVRSLKGLGAGFDCASKGEMAMVLAQGVPPEDIIFAHPAKQVRAFYSPRADLNTDPPPPFFVRSRGTAR